MKTGLAWSVTAAIAVCLSCSPASDTATGTAEPATADPSVSSANGSQKTPTPNMGDAETSRPPRAGSLSPQQQRDLDACLARASAAAQADQVDVAVRNFERVWQLNPNHPYATMYLKDYYLRRGLELYGDGLLDEAIVVWENALRVSPDDKRVQGYLERARKQVARTQQILDDDR